VTYADSNVVWLADWVVFDDKGLASSELELVSRASDEDTAKIDNWEVATVELGGGA
jgi:hypothetical protein